MWGAQKKHFAKVLKVFWTAKISDVNTLKISNNSFWCSVMEILTGIFQDIDDYAVERKHETEWETENGYKMWKKYTKVSFLASEKAIVLK